jgi:hypothetical protein
VKPLFQGSSRTLISAGVTFEAFSEKLLSPVPRLSSSFNDVPRSAMRGAGFSRVVECGLGGTANNFDTMSLHTLPNPRPAEELWPDLTEEDKQKIEAVQERVANENLATKSWQETYAAAANSPANRSQYLSWERMRPALSSPKRSSYSTTVRARGFFSLFPQLDLISVKSMIY